MEDEVLVAVELGCTLGVVVLCCAGVVVLCCELGYKVIVGIFGCALVNPLLTNKITPMRLMI
jgi:hypothetical protein